MCVVPTFQGQGIKIEISILSTGRLRGVRTDTNRISYFIISSGGISYEEKSVMDIIETLRFYSKNKGCLTYLIRCYSCEGNVWVFEDPSISVPKALCNDCVVKA